MAATVSSPWSKPGAWALEAEEHESELQSQQPQNDVADFPSLSAASKQPKKKKAQTVSLAEFNSPKPTLEASRLTHDEILSLPTGPRQRAPEELDRNRLGGGFKSYGVNSRNSEDSSSSRYSRGPRESRELPPSRADEIDDWSKAKKSSGLGFERRERERGSSFFESHSRADESDNWASNKSVETRRFSGGSSFERRGSFDSLSRGREGERNGFGGSESDSWMKREKESSDVPAAGGGARPKLVLQPRTLPVNGNGNTAKPKGSNPFGDARPREEVLAEKGMDHKEIDEKLEAMKINGNGNAKEGEKGRRGSDSGSRWSFGSSGNERGGERAWRKPDAAESGSSLQSGEKTENGDLADENGVATDNGNNEEN